MGYIVYPIAVDLEKVRSAIGSKDRTLLARLHSTSDLKQTDEMLADRFEDDEDGELGAPLTTADILRHLVMGEPYRDGLGFAYGYCFESLCTHFGTVLDNRHWSAMRGRWFDTVQEALAQAGVSEKQFSVGRLVLRGPPVELPAIDDFPGIGYLTKTEVGDARSALARADLAKVTLREAVEAIEQVRGWLDECARSGRDLVCTYA
ncbi:MAG: hypothetical protein J0I06_07610 [Planctomycetes bacterium]|nr:hypothetical protein [Planctomycetota bacterium]